MASLQFDLSKLEVSIVIEFHDCFAAFLSDLLCQHIAISSLDFSDRSAHCLGYQMNGLARQKALGNIPMPTVVKIDPVQIKFL